MIYYSFTVFSLLDCSRRFSTVQWRQLPSMSSWLTAAKQSDLLRIASCQSKLLFSPEARQTNKLFISLHSHRWRWESVRRLYMYLNRTHLAHGRLLQKYKYSLMISVKISRLIRPNPMEPPRVSIGTNANDKCISDRIIPSFAHCCENGKMQKLYLLYCITLRNGYETKWNDITMIVTVLAEHKTVNRKTAANKTDSNQNNALSGCCDGHPIRLAKSVLNEWSRHDAVWQIFPSHQLPNACRQLWDEEEKRWRTIHCVFVA